MQQAAQIEKSINENDKNRKVCIYQGVTYFVATEFNTGKDFIEVDGEKRYLDKNGKVLSKRESNRNVKDCIDSYEDMCKIYRHLMDQKRWNIYLLFVLNYNLSRRVGDLLSAKWSDFFDEKWKVRKFWELTEGKTHKIGRAHV